MVRTAVLTVVLLLAGYTAAASRSTLSSSVKISSSKSISLTKTTSSKRTTTSKTTSSKSTSKSLSTSSKSTPEESSKTITASTSPKPSSSKVTSSVGAVSSSTCPPISVTPTQTVLAQSFIQTYIGTTSTVTFPSYYPAVTETLLTSADVHENVAATTITETDYFTTETSIYNAPAQTTVTVPTPAGFTPIECYSDYVRVTTTVSTTYTATLGDRLLTISTVVPETPTVTVTSYTQINSFLTTTTDVSTTLLLATTTIISTRYHDTSTVYKACATKNVTPNYPGGTYWGGAFANSNTHAVSILAQDPIDCCQICQGNSTCAGSAYSLGDTRLRTAASCTLFIKNAGLDQTCDVNFVGEQAQGSRNQAFVWISNSGCGRYSLLD